MRINMIPSLGLLLTSVLVAHTPQLVAARSNLADQFYELYKSSANLPAPTNLPTPLPDAITKRLKGATFTSLSTPLQQALLWDAGYVVSGNASDASYVQVKVACGLTMNDIFLSLDAIQGTAGCGVVQCNAQTQHYAMLNCSLPRVAKLAKCGIAQDAAIKTEQSNPVWMEGGAINSQVDIQVFRKTQQTTSLFVIQEKPVSVATDDLNGCPNKPQFIFPCQSLTNDQFQNVDLWCPPSPSSLLDLWVAEELTPASDKATGTTTASSKTTTTVFIALFAVACVVCVCLLVCLCHARRRGGKHAHSTGSGFSHNRANSGSNGGGGGGSAGFVALHDHHAMATSHAKLNTNDSDLTSVAAMNPNDRPAFTNAELEKINANFCDRSAELADFCGDQELMMKRISYASLHFAALVARGANGEVWRGEYASQDVAIKRMLRDKQGELHSMEVFAREIRLASTLEHPNIVRFIGLSWRSLSELCMVSEFMPCGDLAHYLLSKESRNLTWQHEKMTLALDIANALVYLHSLMPVIIHRDLKSLNVLLNGELEAKLSDFGLSRERSFEETMTSGVGTMLWTAPEVLRGDRYTEKADIYSYGVVLSELDTCLPPYSLNEQVARAKQKSAQLLPLIRDGRIQPQFRASVPKGVLELATSCLDFLPEKRPNAMQIVYTLRSKVMPTLA